MIVQKVLMAHQDELTQLVVLDDTQFCSSGGDKTIRFWDTRSGKCVHVLKGHSGGVTGLSIVDDTLISTSMDACLLMWNLQILFVHI
jgi:WD40 repeat protein